MTDQEIFDAEYITSSEVIKTVGVTRAALLKVRRSGKLPGDEISLNNSQLFIWKRTPVITAMIADWAVRRNSR
jgi:hypothetical protein